MVMLLIRDSGGYVFCFTVSFWKCMTVCEQELSTTGVQQEEISFKHHPQCFHLFKKNKTVEIPKSRFWDNPWSLHFLLMRAQVSPLPNEESPQRRGEHTNYYLLATSCILVFHVRCPLAVFWLTVWILSDGSASFQVLCSEGSGVPVGYTHTHTHIYARTYY